MSTNLLVGMIWAQGHDRAIGRGGDVPWHVPEDLALFKRVTMGHPVIMGRTTWESLPERFRPLPGRDNIVLTRQSGYDAPGATVVGSWEEAKEAALVAAGPVSPDTPPAIAWVMGGAQIYASGMEHADGIVVTDLDISIPDADAAAPELPIWEIVEAEPERGWLTSTSGVKYRFTALRRPGSAFPARVLGIDSDLQESETL